MPARPILWQFYGSCPNLQQSKFYFIILLVVCHHGATNGVCRVRMYAKETNPLPDVHGKIYCSKLT